MAGPKPAVLPITPPGNQDDVSRILLPRRTLSCVGPGPNSLFQSSSAEVYSIAKKLTRVSAGLDQDVTRFPSLKIQENCQNKSRRGTAGRASSGTRTESPGNLGPASSGTRTDTVELFAPRLQNHDFRSGIVEPQNIPKAAVRFSQTASTPLAHPDAMTVTAPVKLHCIADYANGKARAW